MQADEEIVRFGDRSSWRSRTPRMSSIFISYRHEAYARAALRSALAQDYPMQLIVSDDGSDDGTLRILKQELETWSGIHEIVFRIARRNLGLVKHLNALIPLVEGDAVALFEGDDTSAPSRVGQLARSLHESPETAAVGSLIDVVHGDDATRFWDRPPVFRTGRWGVPDVKREEHLYIYGCVAAWRRAVFDVFGPIQVERVFVDMVLGFRALLLGSLEYVPRQLVTYRLSAASLTAAERRYEYSIESVRQAHQVRAQRTWLPYLSMRKDMRTAIESGRCARSRVCLLWLRYLWRFAIAAHLDAAVIAWSRPRILAWALLSSLAGGLPAQRMRALRLALITVSPWSFFMLKRIRHKA